MHSKKCQKYMNKYEERNYAPKNRKIEKSDISKYSNGNSRRETSESSSCDSLQQSRKEQEEIEDFVINLLTEEEITLIGDNGKRPETVRKSKKSILVKQDIPKKQPNSCRKKRSS